MSSCASTPGRSSINQGPLAAASTQTAGPGLSLPYRAHSSMKNLTVNLASQNCPSGDTFPRYPLEGHQTSVTQTDPLPKDSHCRYLHGWLGDKLPSGRGTALKGVSGLQHPLEGTWNLDATAKSVSLPVPCLGQGRYLDPKEKCTERVRTSSGLPRVTRHLRTV